MIDRMGDEVGRLMDQDIVQWGKGQDGDGRVCQKDGWS